MLQSWLSRASPGQDFPPKLGAGRVQLLERSLKPVPQDLLQEVHSVQSDHPPSTEKHKNKTKKEREKKKEKNPQCYYLQTAKWGLLTRKERTVNKQIYLKCHWDQNFGIPYFCIFENSLWLLVTMPNFNSLRRLEVAFFGRFLSRFYGRHYWPLFRKPACELAEVTLEAHLKLSTFHTVTCHGKFNSRPGKISCQSFAVRPWNFRCCSSYKGYYLCCTMLQQ